MSQPLFYHIVMSTSSKHLVGLVQDHLNIGATLVGGVSPSPDRFAKFMQAVMTPNRKLHEKAPPENL